MRGTCGIIMKCCFLVLVYSGVMLIMLMLLLWRQSPQHSQAQGCLPFHLTWSINVISPVMIPVERKNTAGPMHMPDLFTTVVISCRAKSRQIARGWGGICLHLARITAWTADKLARLAACKTLWQAEKGSWFTIQHVGQFESIIARTVMLWSFGINPGFYLQQLSENLLPGHHRLHFKKSAFAPCGSLAVAIVSRGQMIQPAVRRFHYHNNPDECGQIQKLSTSAPRGWWVLLHSRAYFFLQSGSAHKES